MIDSAGGRGCRLGSRAPAGRGTGHTRSGGGVGPGAPPRTV
ncbi:hypothetical protein J2S58_001399 [Nakamurella flavida]|nr:hypothetical protein [Nakamurella flavida]